MIINLQQTERDNDADLVIRAKCDLVFELLMPVLRTKIPVYGSHKPMKFVLPEPWTPPPPKPQPPPKKAAPPKPVQTKFRTRSRSRVATSKRRYRDFWKKVNG